MAESKILTRGELHTMFSEAIPDYFKADGWEGEFSIFDLCFYGDNDYNPDRCASKITSTMTMEAFLLEYVGSYVEVLATPESLSNYTYSLGDGQLIPENSMLDPRRIFSGGKFSRQHNCNTSSLITTANNGIEITLNFFIGSETYKKIIYSTNIPLTHLGSLLTNNTYSFITSNQGISIELIYSNVSSANITELTLSSTNDSDSISITLTKSSETTSKSVFTALINKIQMDTLLSTNNLLFTIKGNLVGTAQADVPYTFDLKTCYQLADTSINLTSFYGKGSSQVRLAYDNSYLFDAKNEIILYGNNWNKLWSTTQATLNNFVLTVPNIHEVAESYSDSYNYLFLKVPLEFYDYSFGWTRTVLYYPLTLSTYNVQYLQLNSGPLYLGMCNYHTTSGDWKWVLENNARYNTTIYLPNEDTNANWSSAATVNGSRPAEFNELDMPCTHLIHLRATSNYNYLLIGDNADGGTSYRRFGATTTRVSLIPNSVSNFESLVVYLNQNESENIYYKISYSQEY